MDLGLLLAGIKARKDILDICKGKNLCRNLEKKFFGLQRTIADAIKIRSFFK